MIGLKSLAAVLALTMLTACGGLPGLTPTTSAPVDVTQLPAMRVASFTVTVPESLSVSEDNSYDPNADIVWRADPFGPRHPQIKTVMEDGIAAGIGQLDGSRPVVLDIVVQRFHSQTKKVRYSFGGKYEIEYDLTVRDAGSGDTVIPTYRVYAIEDAPGGREAVAADQAGQTEKIDNLNLIAGSIYTQLTGNAPESLAVGPGS